MQTATLDDVFREHGRNVNAAHRNVGLVIETRPDSINCESLTLMRALGCTKIQMGVQSLNEHVLEANKRHTSPEQIAQAFALCRLFSASNRTLISRQTCLEPRRAACLRFPHACKRQAILARRGENVPLRAHRWHGAHGALCRRHVAAYNERELVGVLADNVLATPPYTRISRMIRDFSSGDIVDGNKKVNLREVVEAEADKQPHKTTHQSRRFVIANSRERRRKSASFRSSISNTKPQTQTSISCSG